MKDTAPTSDSLTHSLTHSLTLSLCLCFTHSLSLQMACKACSCGHGSSLPPRALDRAPSSPRCNRQITDRHRQSLNLEGERPRSLCLAHSRSACPLAPLCPLPRAGRALRQGAETRRGDTQRGERTRPALRALHRATKRECSAGVLNLIPQLPPCLYVRRVSLRGTALAVNSRLAPRYQGLQPRGRAPGQ